MTSETKLGALATEAVRSDGPDLGATSTPLLVGMMADDMADVQAALRGASAAVGSSTSGLAPRDALRSWTLRSACPPSPPTRARSLR